MSQFGGIGNIPDVVKNLIILNVIVFISIMLFDILQIRFPLFYPSSVYFQPYQIVTNMFTHFGPLHLLINMFVLWQLGSVVERTIGPEKMFIAYIACGLGGGFLHLTWAGINIFMNEGSLFPHLNEVHNQISYNLIKTRVLGASGATSGIALIFSFYYPNTKMMIFPIPFPIEAKKLILFFAAGSLVVGIFGLLPGIAHFGHLGGLLVGYVLVTIWKKDRNRFY